MKHWFKLLSYLSYLPLVTQLFEIIKQMVNLAEEKFRKVRRGNPTMQEDSKLEEKRIMVVNLGYELIPPFLRQRATKQEVQKFIECIHKIANSILETVYAFIEMTR